MFINVQLTQTGERQSFNANEVFSVKTVQIVDENGSHSEAQITFKNGETLLVHHAEATICNACQTAQTVGVVQVA